MFKVFGIQLAVHASFLLLLAYYGYEGWVEGGITGLWFNVAMILFFFVCVILHELGHSLTARRYGVRTSRILLLPIGGMAELEQIPRKSSAELLITIAGPAVNFVLVALLLPFVWRGVFSEEEVTLYSATHMVYQLWFGNLIMGCFNLLPVFPMDGGRILRALLAIRLTYLRATWLAAVISKVLAPIFALIAFFVLDWQMVGVLFIFIFFVGDMEYRQTLRREQEEAYWAEMARRARMVAPVDDEPPLLIHGRN